MAITTAGVNYLAQAAIGAGTPFNNANAFIGVGDGSQAFSASQTDLQGTNKVRRPMDSNYPTVTPPVATFMATFPQNEANFAWNEWALFNASTGGVMLNRTVESNGTKQSNQTWVLEVSITFAIGN